MLVGSSKVIAVKALVIAVAVLFPCVAFASSDDAWNDLDKAAKAACTAEIKKDADISTVRVNGTVLGIGGKSGDQYYALVLKGTAKAYSTQVLCLYDKVSKKVQTSEITTP